MKLQTIIGNTRPRRVIERATKEAGWGRDMPEGRGLGLAFHHSFVSYTAIVFEVEVDDVGEPGLPPVAPAPLLTSWETLKNEAGGDDARNAPKN